MDEIELKRLIRRVERLVEEESLSAPTVIKAYELRLIIDSCNKLLSNLEGEN